MRHTKQHPCAECPFRKASAPGWLGPDKDPERMINRILGLMPVGGMFIGVEPVDFACHRSTAEVIGRIEAEGGGHHTVVPKSNRGELEHCVGALLAMKARCRMPKDRAKVDAMRSVSAKEPMLLKREDFIAHHSKFNQKKP